MRNEMRGTRGFTLAELLIVVAIIAVLTAVAIPVFSGTLERAKESADLANIRGAYAEAAMEMLDSGSGERTVDVVQNVSGWEAVNQGAMVGANRIADELPDIRVGDVVRIKVDENGNLTLTKE